MKPLRLLFAAIVLLAVLWVWWFHLPYGPTQETFVDIPAGTSTTGIAHRLAAAHIIRSPLSFLIYRRLHPGTLHAGEYRFTSPATLAQVYYRLQHNDVYTLSLVIPEGYNLYDIAAAVQSAGLGSQQAFLDAAHARTNLIADLAPAAPSLEGFLFPDTYAFNRHATPDQILTAMVKRFRQVGGQIGLLPPGQPPPANLLATVTLASLVEKEVHIDAERPLVAGVFVNRIAARIPLATDPAVVYAALREGRWRGVIHRSDLDFDSPWNTYLHPGLPPGPIANPGVAALKAAMHPARTDYLYFVAAPDGGATRFSRDLEEHNHQVQLYRQSLPQQ